MENHGILKASSMIPERKLSVQEARIGLELSLVLVCKRKETFTKVVMRDT